MENYLKLAIFNSIIYLIISMLIILGNKLKDEELIWGSLTFSLVATILNIILIFIK